METCVELKECAFVSCCEEYRKDDSIEGFISIYCKGPKMSSCIRLKLANKFGKEVVPKNMMPNGLPLPGTTKEGWSGEAKNFRRIFE